VSRTRRVVPTPERPRERLERLGAEALSERELVALIVGSGTGSHSASTIARDLLSAADGSLSRLARLPLAVLRRVPGVGHARASQVCAALELGRRVAAGSGEAPVAVRGPEDVMRLLGPRLRDLRQEEFHVLLLDAQHRVLRDVTVTRGILNASLVHPREILRPAIEESAAALILVHNHPSGDPTPSAEDRAVTVRITQAAAAVGIPVLDHVVVAREGFTSIRPQAAA